MFLFLSPLRTVSCLAFDLLISISGARCRAWDGSSTADDGGPRVSPSAPTRGPSSGGCSDGTLAATNSTGALALASRGTWGAAAFQPHLHSKVSPRSVLHSGHSIRNLLTTGGPPKNRQTPRSVRAEFPVHPRLLTNYLISTLPMFLL